MKKSPIPKKTHPKRNRRIANTEEEDKLVLLFAFRFRWLKYSAAVNRWIVALYDLKLLDMRTFHWGYKDRANVSKFYKKLEKCGIKEPDFLELRQEAEEAAIPVLDYLFGPNEIAVIPRFQTTCPEGINKWFKVADDINQTMENRFYGARNRIRAEKFKTGARIIPRSGWSQPFPMKHWAKIFNCDRKTVKFWFDNNYLLARKLGTKWQVANDELQTSSFSNTDADINTPE